MPSKGLSLSTDISFTVNTPAGPLTFSGRTSYEPKPMYTDLKHKPMGKPTVYDVTPDGWQIGIKLERKGPELDRYFAQWEENYFAKVNNGSITILETIVEPDGTVSQYQYTDCVLKYDEAGTWKSDAYIPISVTAMASRRIALV